MKNKITNAVINISFVSILVTSFLFTNNLQVYAENETETSNKTVEAENKESSNETSSSKSEETQKTNSSENSNSGVTTNKQTTTQKSNNSTSTSNGTKTTKSSNANLSNLGIRPHDFSGFNPGTTTYNTTVPENTSSIEIYAKVQNSKAKVTGTGKKELEKGQNKFSVVVTAEDGTTKTYTLNINRSGEDEEEYNQEGENTNEEGLKKLKLNDLELTPEFKTNVYEYKTKYIGEEEKLNIEAIATKDDYVVEIVGNEKLKEGENTITILVSTSEGDNVATYQVIVDKSLVDEEAVAKEAEQKKKILIIGSVIALILIIVIIIIIKHKRKKNYDEYFSEDEEENEIPRALSYKEKEFHDILKENNDTDNKEKLPKKESKDEEDLDLDFNNPGLSKENIKKQFLDNYNNNDDDIDELKKKKGKGKRYK